MAAHSIAAEIYRKDNSMPLSRDEWPKVSLVTPVYNSGKYIESTICSVLAQQYPNLEYVVVDGGSTDGTLEIVRKYQTQMTGWVSEPDQGMYDALNKGFARTSGEIMGWISATDMLHVGALLSVGAIFRGLPEVEWITGRPTRFNEYGMTTAVEGVPHWSRARFLAGFNRYIQQESTFWRRSLWDKAGGKVDASLRMAGDFELWLRFFRFARLYPVDGILGGFRLHDSSLGIQRLAECHALQETMISTELNSESRASAIRAFRTLSSNVKRIPGFRYFWWRLVERIVPVIPGPDWAPTIRFNDSQGWHLSGRSRN
jgi:glycosyltransferase involved in cell wall biosynthesis